jgi:two-component system, sensor histidine kinase and response regulator
MDSEVMGRTAERKAALEIDGGSEEVVNILLVDDRQENLLALEAVLGDLGQNLIRATSGAEALRAILEREYAVILLDVQIPGMDGFEIAAMIREREKSLHTPIIFLTAFDKSYTHASRGYKIGAVDYMLKPFDTEILRAKVRVFIDLFRKTNEIKKLNATLERRVRQRTADLEMVNARLMQQITERQQAEREIKLLNEQLEKRVKERTADLTVANQELEAFCYSVSHDLRAPLRRVRMFVNLFQEEHGQELNESGEEFLRRIANSVDKMDALIGDLLRLSRVSRTTVTRQDVDLSEVARGIAGDLAQSNPDRKVRFEVKEGMTVEGDPKLLHVALYNLLNNAWKFTEQREESLIEVGTTNQDGETVFYVKDNGAGFDMEHADKLFQPFQRLHQESEFPGTGIGLAIVHRVIERHGGRVWAEGKPDRGATFHFTM